MSTYPTYASLERQEPLTALNQARGLLLRNQQLRKFLGEQIGKLESHRKKLEDDGALLAARIEELRLAGGSAPPTLVYSARTRCLCGAGLAYPEGDTMVWSCSRVLLEGDDGLMHDVPFAGGFMSVISEQDPRARGDTTRPRPPAEG